MNSFEKLCGRLERRGRFLQGLTAMSWALLGTLGLTALALLLGSLGAVPMVPVLGWVAINILIAMFAFVGGWLRPFNLAALLFRADRNAHSDEILVTLHELKSGQGPSEFIPLLERRLTRLSLDVAQALPIEKAERKRWGGVLGLALFCLMMTSFIPAEVFVLGPAKKEHSTATPPSGLSAPAQLPQEALELMPPPTELAPKIPAWRERLHQAQAALAHNPNDARARALLEQLQAEIGQAQDRLRNVFGADTEPPRSSSDKSHDDASLVETPAGEIRSPNRETPSDPSALDRLLQNLQSLQGQAHELTPEEMQKLLEQLRQENPIAALIVGRALQTSGGSREFREQLGEILKNLQQRRDLSEQLEQLQREAQSALSQTQSQTARSGAEAEHQSSSAGSAGDASPSDDPNAPESQESLEGPREENSASKPSGSRGSAPLDPEAVKDLPDLSALQEHTQRLSMPATDEEDLQILFDIISLGLPQKPDPQGRPAPVQLDYQKIETMLDLLEIPGELRHTVRQYFLSLAK